MHGVDSIGIRMRKPIHNPMIEIRSIMLAREDSGDAYMGEVPAVDEFGQSNPVEEVWCAMQSIVKACTRNFPLPS